MFSRETIFRKAFALGGREAKELVLQFQRHEFENLQTGDPIEVQLDVLLGGRRKWKKLIAFSILVPRGGFRPELAVIDLAGGDETGEA